MKRRVRTDGVLPAESKGARSATADSAGGATTGGPLGPGQRWSAGRKRDVVLRLLRGESIEALSRELGVERYRLEDWKRRGLDAIEASVKERGADPLQSRECVLLPADHRGPAPGCCGLHLPGLVLRMADAGLGRESSRPRGQLLRVHDVLHTTRLRQLRSDRQRRPFDAAHRGWVGNPGRRRGRLDRASTNSRRITSPAPPAPSPASGPRSSATASPRARRRAAP